MTGTYCKIVASKLFSKIITTIMSLIITGHSTVVALYQIKLSFVKTYSELAERDY